MSKEISRGFLYCATEQSGIQVSRFCEQKDIYAPFVRATEPCANTFIALHPSLPRLYAVDSSSDNIRSYRMENDGMLTPLEEMRSEGAPCHLAIDPAGLFILVANYLKSVSLFSLDIHGGLLHLETTLERSHDANDSPLSHPHGITFFDKDHLAYLADLGADAVFAFQLNESRTEIIPRPELTTRIPSGSGPRHLAFTPDNTRVAVVNELSNTLSFFEIDRTTRKLTTAGSVHLLPKTADCKSWAAEVAYHPNGETCYASNRGHDSLAIVSGFRSPAPPPEPKWIKSGGEWPQHLLFNKSGSRLFVANTRSDRISLFDIDPKTGLPGKKMIDLEIPKPVCLALSCI